MTDRYIYMYAMDIAEINKWIPKPYVWQRNLTSGKMTQTFAFNKLVA
jgi:hypothetical protein